MQHYLHHRESQRYGALRSVHDYVSHREPKYMDEWDYWEFLGSAWCLRDGSYPKWTFGLHCVAYACRTPWSDQLLNLAVERMALFPNRLRVSTKLMTDKQDRKRNGDSCDWERLREIERECEKVCVCVFGCVCLLCILGLVLESKMSFVYLCCVFDLPKHFRFSRPCRVLRQS